MWTSKFFVHENEVYCKVHIQYKNTRKYEQYFSSNNDVYQESDRYRNLLYADMLSFNHSIKYNNKMNTTIKYEIACIRNRITRFMARVKPRLFLSCNKEHVSLYWSNFIVRMLWFNMSTILITVSNYLLNLYFCIQIKYCSWKNRISTTKLPVYPVEVSYYALRRGTIIRLYL